MTQQEVNHKNVDETMKFLNQKKEIHDAYKELKLKREEFDNKQVEIKERQKKINLEDEKIQNSLNQFCVFIQKNELKKQRAKEQIKVHKNEIEMKTKQIEELTRKIQEEEELRNHLQIKERELKKYEDFLEVVVKNNPDQYQSINDLLMRYKNLKESIDMLKDKTQKIEIQYGELKEKFEQEEKDAQKIQNLQKELESKEMQRKEMANMAQNSQNQSQSQNVLISKILLAVDNLHN